MASWNNVTKINWLTPRYNEVSYKNVSLAFIIYPGSSYSFVSFLRHVYKVPGHELVIPVLDMIHFPLEPELQRDRIATM